MPRRQSRRAFLGHATRITAGWTVLAGARSARGYAANERLHIALVGVGGRGSWFVGSIPSLGEHVVAMCDVNEERAAASFSRLPKAKKHRDYRKMLDDPGLTIDAVVVATPDHHHAGISLAAMERGKHVYCEKPLTHDIREARRVREAATRAGVATQMGNQGTASQAYRRAMEIVATGALGEVREVLVWNTGGGPGDRPLPSGSPPVPPTLAWDLWLGPARERPYHPQWLRWHGWREFGTGQLGNWGCHTMNLAFRALRIQDLWSPAGDIEPGRIRVRAEASGIHQRSFPRRAKVEYDVPARGKLPPVRLTWHNGPGRIDDARERLEAAAGRPLDWGDKGEKKWRDHAGCVLVGSKGSMVLNAHNTTLALVPEETFRDFRDPEPFVLRSPGHEKEWLRACRGGTPALSSFDHAGPLTEFALLGNVATRVEGEFAYDPVAMEVPGRPDVARHLRREYREPWEI